MSLTTIQLLNYAAWMPGALGARVIVTEDGRLVARVELVAGE